MLEKCKVVMLSTNEKASSRMILSPSKKLCTITSYNKETNITEGYFPPDEFHPKARFSENGSENWRHQHLYILSNDEVKKDDYYYTEARTSEYGIHLCDSERLVQICKELKAKKVIATTDKSLNLPGVSQSFIEKYIEKYNKGKKIEEVNVIYIKREFYSNGLEYYCNKCNGHENNCFCEEDIFPKVKDKTISIKKIKTSWNREEVTKLLHLALATGSAYGDEMNESDANNWIKENL